jgi:NAD+ synthase
MHMNPSDHDTPLADALHIDPAQTAVRLERFIRGAVSDYQRDGVLLGLSGGIDSAVVAILAVRALGADRVSVLLLPERDSSPSSKFDALIEIARLGIGYREVSITPMLSALGIYDLLPLQILGIRQVKSAVVRRQHGKQAEALGETPFRAGLLGTRDLGAPKHLIDAGNAYARAKHRARLITLYFYADQENRLVLGTTNRSEAQTGFVVKWGDNVADVEPILPLYKTQVRRLAAYLGVSQAIIDKAPSPDLLPGIVDELALGLDYPTLDLILCGLDRGWADDRIAGEAGATVEQAAHVREMQRRSAHLRAMPPAPDPS